MKSHKKKKDPVHPKWYAFYLTWFCNRSWRKRDTTQEDNCNAKIDIYVKKPEPSSSKYDEYLHYDPPLPCVIEIAGQHSHPLEQLDCKIVKGVRDQVKREFFKYFQMGLSVSDAKTKYAVRYRHKKSAKPKHTPTLRQAQRLYNQWKGVKRWSTMKEGDLKESQPKAITFKEILDAVPKREILYSVKHLLSETEIPLKSDAKANNKDIKFPLVFISVGSAAAMPCNTAPLLYKLKHGIAGEIVSDLVKPRIYSICIDSAAAVVVVKGQLTETSQESQNSSGHESDVILGVPMSVDETPVTGESASTEILNIPIKTEPLNDGYDEEPIQGSIEKTPNLTEDNSMMPVITEAFSCGNGTITEEVEIKPNICFNANAITEETDIKPNICCDKAGNSFFPLVFTLKGSIYEASNGRSLVYDLKQGSTGVQATEVVIPQISSVQINSLNEAAFQFKDASMLKAEGPLSIKVETEFSEAKLNSTSNGNTNERVYEKDIIPVIINASSCSDLFPVIADSIIGWSKKPREDLVVSPVAPIKAVINKPVLQRKKLCKNVATKQVIVTEIDKNDEDYQFLMSLLPEMKRLPPEDKNSVKNRIKDVFLTNRLAANRIQYEKKSTNIYRDCGVLPISGGWKF
ncbi:hypothetical protein HNY73_002782 [Argiope bruennichi]|uniref:BESS domain-containing protein n=1 Tax=Argiope bruennichi TaxID=94029 RepID=A0A8T0FZ10_ARGBR|nr:hypothetical protein HNY73_002782 [Argiope bruennichi]